MINKEEAHDAYKKALDEINRKRTELQSSDLPYKIVTSTLAKLNEKEKVLLAKLDKLNNPKANPVLTGVITGTAIIGGLAALGIILSKVLAEEEDSDEDSIENISVGDKVGDTEETIDF
jgi:hypothetical protein